MAVFLFLLLLAPNSNADMLLDNMISEWAKEAESSEYVDQSDAEVYHWELGTPDNIPEIEIIYDKQEECSCY